MTPSHRTYLIHESPDGHPVRSPDDAAYPMFPRWTVRAESLNQALGFAERYARKATRHSARSTWRSPTHPNGWGSGNTRYLGVWHDRREHDGSTPWRASSTTRLQTDVERIITMIAQTYGLSREEARSIVSQAQEELAR